MSMNTLHQPVAQSNRRLYYVGPRKVLELDPETYTVHKILRDRTHYLHKPSAIAVDVQCLCNAESDGAQFIEVLDAETGALYWAPIARLRERGTYFDRGYGYQIYLPLKWWDRLDLYQQMPFPDLEVAA